MFDTKSHRADGNWDALVREIAEHSAATTMPEFSAAAEQMSTAELRGYVRAHAWPQICAELQHFEVNKQLPKSIVNALAARALEQTVHLVMSAYISMPVTAIPAPHIGRRAAA
jgi:hypothetical protein